MSSHSPITICSSPELTDDESFLEPSTSKTRTNVKPNTIIDISISSDEDDQLMSDLASRASILTSDSDDLIETSSSFEDERSPVKPNRKQKMSKTAVIDAMFPKQEQYTDVWISSKTIQPERKVKEEESVPSSAVKGPPQHTVSIGGVEVHFPVKPYGCQIALMFKVIIGCNKSLNCLLESPTGSGKTLALLCGALAWQRKERARIKNCVKQQLNAEIWDKVPPPSPPPPTTPDQPFKRTLFGDGNIYNGARVKVEGGGDASPVVFKRPEPLEEDFADASGDAGLVKIHKRRKLTGGDVSPAPVIVPESPEKPTNMPTSPKKYTGSPYKNAPTSNNVTTPDKTMGAATSYGESPNKNMGNRTNDVRTPNKSEQTTPEQSPRAPKQETPKSVRELRGYFDNLDLRTRMFVGSSLPKIYYGARTHKQIAQVVKEFKRTSYVGETRMSILSSREHSCIHDFDRSIYKSKNDMCRALITSRPSKDQRSRRQLDDNATNCPCYDNRWELSDSDALPEAWDLEDLVAKGREIGSCPYYAARSMAEKADIVFCPYNYLIDPGIKKSLQIDVCNDIVILDEAHNIEDVCRDSASLTLTREELLRAIDEIDGQLVYFHGELGDHILNLHQALKNWDYWFQNQQRLLQDKTAEFGEVFYTWEGKHFAATLENHNIGYSKFISFKMSTVFLSNTQRENSDKLFGVTTATVNLLDAIATSLDYLFRNACANLEDFKPTLVKTVSMGDEPPVSKQGWRSTQFSQKASTESLSLRLLCMNPAIVFSELSRASCIVLSSGTLTPIISLHSELGSEFPLVLSTAHVIPEDRVWVGSLLSCPDGERLECTSKGTSKPATQDALGQTLLWVCSKTPNGVLCFLPSYMLMNKLVKRWQETGLWQQLQKTKHLFMESRNGREHNEIMEDYYSVVGTVKGALLIAVYRGKVSEGMDFKDEQARAVITVGIPYPNTFDCTVTNKKEYNDSQKHRNLLPGNEWLRVQAYRALNQAVGRCVRHRGDWGAVLLVDARFSNPYYTEHLSAWVKKFLGNNHHSWNRLVNSADSLESFMQSMTLREVEDQDWSTL